MHEFENVQIEQNWENKKHNNKRLLSNCQV